MNANWNYPTAVRAAQPMEPLGIFWLEDPMPWFDERYTLQRLKAATTICGAVDRSPGGGMFPTDALRTRASK